MKILKPVEGSHSAPVGSELVIKVVAEMKKVMPAFNRPPATLHGHITTMKAGFHSSVRVLSTQTKISAPVYADNFIAATENQPFFLAVYMELTTAPKTAGYPSKTWWYLEVVKLFCDLDFKYILDSTAPTQDGPEITDLAFNVAAKHNKIKQIISTGAKDRGILKRRIKKKLKLEPSKPPSVAMNSPSLNQ